MFKKSSKVFSMLIAFAMAASVFVAPNAFADGGFKADEPIKATVTAVFLVKNANGVFQKDPSGLTNVVTSDGINFCKTGEDKPATEFIVGENYTIKFEQDSNQKSTHNITGAKIGVKLNGSSEQYYNEYVEEVNLSYDPDNTTYEGSFTALGSAAKLGGGGIASVLTLYIYFETNDDANVTAKGGTYSENGTYSKGETDSIVKVQPLKNENDVAVDSIKLKAGHDAYFKVTADSGYYIDSYSVTAKAFDKDNNEITKSLTLDTSKGIDIYKLSADDVSTLLKEARKDGSIEVTAEAKKIIKDSEKSITNNTGYTIASSAAPGSIVKISDESGKPIECLKFEDSNKEGEEVSVNIYYTGLNTASFIMPKNDITIEKTAKAKLKLADELKEEDKWPVHIDTDNEENENSISYAPGTKKKVKFKPNDNKIYPALTNSGNEYRIGYNINNWKFDFLGVEDGCLLYDVTFGSTDLEVKEFITTEHSGNDNANILRRPSLTDKFIPALKFNQRINNSGKADVRLTSWSSPSSVGGPDENKGVISEDSKKVTINFDNSYLKAYYIRLAEEKASIDADENAAGGVTAKFNFEDFEEDLKKGKSLLLDIDVDYKYGKISIDKTGKGTVIAKDNSKKTIDRCLPDGKVYLVATPETGYRLASITAKEDNNNANTISLEKAGGNTYRFVMPNSEVQQEEDKNKGYGTSVIVEARFVENLPVIRSVEVTNLVPKADKAKNKGYAETDFGTTAHLEVGKEFTVEYIANDNCKFVEATLQYKDINGEDKILKATKVDGNKYTYKVPSDVNIVHSTISIGAKFANIIKVENKSAEADKAKNNGYITLDATEVLAGDVINGTVTVVEGYKVANVSYSYTNSDKKTVTKDLALKDNAFKLTVPNDVIAEGVISIEAKFNKSGEEADKNAWVKDGDNWTYWKDGKQVTGWFQDGGKDWFYCDPKTGFMKTGWFQDGGSTWYYCFTREDATERGNKEGAMAANHWVRSNNKWYYLNKAGAMESNKWVKDADDILWSWVGEDGAFLYNAD